MQTTGKSLSYYYMSLCLFILLLIPVCVPSSVAVAVVSVRQPALRVVKKSIETFSERKLSASAQKEVQALAVQSVARWYMQALLAQKYDDMWLALDPHIRQKWPNEAVFAAFWHTRFQDYTLYGFTLGNVRNWPDWTDPDTMLRYTHLMGLSVSLQLTLRHPPRAGTQLPPENLHPELLFRNLPFVMQYHQTSPQYLGKWLVLVGGPADLEAPILPPVAPLHRIAQVPILVYHHVLPYYSTQPLSDYTLPWVVESGGISVADGLSVGSWLSHYYTQSPV